MATTARTAQIGRYQIERQLGRGAMGVVYLASDPVIGRRIALKVLRFDLPGAEESAERLRSRFQREARSAGILSHPNIVTVYDAIEETADGALCIAMEYVEGTNLSDILRRSEPLSPDFGLDVAAQIADALDYAHDQGVIHRDIKPANVIVTPNGRVKITDFGIAHLIDSALSDDLRFLGTPSYMAPERIEGREIDQRADLFSLGVVLYQLITRHMPFKGSSVADLTRSIARDAPIPPEQYAPEITAELRGIVHKTLEKNPDRRYQDAGSLATDLRALLSRIAAVHRTQPVGAERTGPVAVAELPIPPQSVPPQHVPPQPAAPAPAPRPGGRYGILGLGALGVLILVAVSVWLARAGGDSGATAPDSRPAPVHQAALAQGVARLAAGDTLAARELLRSAEMLGPGSMRAHLWRQLADDRLRRDEAALREIEVYDEIETARAALARGRLREADEALERARLIDPDNPLVADVQSRLWLARQPKAAPEPEIDEMAARPPPPPKIEAQVIPLERPVVSTVATIELDFFSALPRGVVTIYEGQRQIYKEAFRFYERRRLLPPKAATGSLHGKLEMAAGDISWRVYLSLPGQETQVVPVDGTLRGGGRHVLRMRVSAEGQFTAELQ
jgi:predicted Ser/Thr protein kinase